jgi:uncharacterized repeat protein (TIGR01451 family)
MKEAVDHERLNSAHPEAGSPHFASTPEPASASIAPTGLTATLTDGLTQATTVSPGDTITYTATIQNNGAIDATGVSFSDTVDANTTFVAGSLNSSPIAIDQSFVTNEDSAANVTLTGLDPDGGALTFKDIGIPSHGALSGTAPNLIYTPEANFSGSDSFNFRVNDGKSDSDQVGIVSITVNAVNDAPSFIKGASQSVSEDSPAQSISGWATAISTGPASESGQTASFIITENTNTALFSVAPAVSSTGTLTYALAANQNGSAMITLKIKDNGGTDNGGVDESATQTFTITVNAVNDAPIAQAKNFTAQANMKLALGGLLSGVTDADSGVNGCTPTFTVASISATSPVGGNITNVNVTAGTFDFDPPPGVAGNVTFTYTVNDNGCAGTATSVPATVTVNVTGPVIWFVNPAAATNGDGRLSNPFKFLAGNAGPNNDADDVDGIGHRIFLFSGTHNAGMTLNNDEQVFGQSAAHVSGTFDGLMGISPPATTIARPPIGTATPLVQSSSVGFTLAQNNHLQSCSMSTSGTSVNGAAVGTLTIEDLVINNTTGGGINLTTSGTVTITGLNTIDTTTGTPLSVSNVNIGEGGLTFRRISSNGAANGIVLDTTGTAGGLTVTGNSSGLCGGQVGGSPLSITTTPNTADCSGGRIQNTTGGDGTTSGIGIRLNNTTSVSLTRMQLDNHANFAIRGTSVTGFTLTNSLINGTNGSTTSPDEGSISFTNLLGASSITNSTVRGGFEDNIQVKNNTGTMTLTISGSTIRDNSTANGNDGVFAQADGASNANKATMTLKVLNSVLQRNRGDHVNTTQNDFGVMNAVVTGNTMTFNGTIGQPFDPATTAGGSVTVTTGANFTGTSTFNISNNNITGAKTSPINVNNASNSSAASGVLSGTISGNTIGLAGAVGSGSGDGDGIDVIANGNANITVNITNNSVRQWKLLGLNMVARDGAATIFASVSSNSIGEPSNTTESLQSIVFNAGPAGTETGTSCVNIGGTGALANGFPGPFTAGITPLRVRQRAINTVRLPGYAGGAFDTAGVNTFLSARNNNVSTSSTANNVAGAGGFVGGGACTQGSVPNIVGSKAEDYPVYMPIIRADVASARAVRNAHAVNSQPTFSSNKMKVVERSGLPPVRAAIAAYISPAAYQEQMSSDPIATGKAVVRDDRSKRGRIGAEGSSSHGHLRELLLDATFEKENRAPRGAANLSASSSPLALAFAGETVVGAGSGFTLPANKSITISFKVTVNNQPPNFTQVSNQGVVSGSNFSNVLTDDPEAAGAADPTVTSVLAPPDMSIKDASTNEPSAGSKLMAFTVVLSHASANNVFINYATTSGGANPGEAGLNGCAPGADYVDTFGKLTFMPGQTVQTISVEICSDGDSSETDETFLMQLSAPSNATVTDGEATGTISVANLPGTVLISELRTSGPGASGIADPDDEFVELYNNTASDLVIAASDASTGWAIVKTGASCSDNPEIIAIIPNGTVIPARGHYLVVGSGYSLSAIASGDDVLTSGIADGQNVALFNTANAANLSTGNLIDAVGFSTNTGNNCDLLREGRSLLAVSGSTSEHSFVRKLVTGMPKDTNDNVVDFEVVSTTPSTPVGDNLTPALGAPGPENASSPVQRNGTIKASLIDPTAALNAPPNRIRSAVGANPSNAAFGTLDIRRKFTNTTGGPITSLRFRVVDITTRAGAGAPPAGTADLRLLTSLDTHANGGTIIINGTTLHAPLQPNGGGINSSAIVALPGGTLANGASINVRFLLGVQQDGLFRFLINVEALPGLTGVPGDGSSTKSRMTGKKRDAAEKEKLSRSKGR